MKKLFRRATSETPDWWRKVRNTSAAIAVIGGAILVAPISIPVSVAGIITTIVTISGTIAGTAQCTVKNPEKLD